MAAVQSAPQPEVILRHLLESAEQARAAKQVGWRLFESHVSFTFEFQAGTGKPVASSGSNPGVPGYQKYKDFFDIIELSLLHTMVLGVCRIFDSRPDHASVYKYLALVEPRLGAQRVKEFKRRLQPLMEVAEQLGPARNEFTAHLHISRTVDEALRDSAPFKLVSSHFLDDLATILNELNELRNEAGIEQENQVTTDDTYAEAARGVLSALIYGLPCVDKDGLVRMKHPIPEP